MLTSWLQSQGKTGDPQSLQGTLKPSSGGSGDDSMVNALTEHRWGPEFGSLEPPELGAVLLSCNTVHLWWDLKWWLIFLQAHGVHKDPDSNRVENRLTPGVAVCPPHECRGTHVITCSHAHMYTRKRSSNKPVWLFKTCVAGDWIQGPVHAWAVLCHQPSNTWAFVGHSRSKFLSAIW